MEQHPATGRYPPQAIANLGNGGPDPSNLLGFALATRVPMATLQVLVVEDSWHIAGAIKSVVETVGMTVVGPAATLADAEALLAASAPDLAVVDINLQGQLTYSLIEALIKRGIAVVIVSGYEILPDIANRADAVLKKPIRAGVLLSTLQRIAASRRKT